MNGSNKKDYLFIIAVLIVVCGIAFLSSNSYQRLVNEYPDQIVQLTADDFRLANTVPPIDLGESTGKEVKQVFPQGKTLGMSSVYRPAGQDNVFTFTKNSDVLTKVDISGSGLTTARGIAFHDSFDKVVKAYGKGYVKSYKKNDPQSFDAIYGEKQYIVFHVKDGVVQRIVLQYPVTDKKQ